jgi:hypothetical protein
VAVLGVAAVKGEGPLVASDEVGQGLDLAADVCRPWQHLADVLQQQVQAVGRAGGPEDVRELVLQQRARRLAVGGVIRVDLDDVLRAEGVDDTAQDVAEVGGVLGLPLGVELR